MSSRHKQQSKSICGKQSQMQMDKSKFKIWRKSFSWRLFEIVWEGIFIARVIYVRRREAMQRCVEASLRTYAKASKYHWSNYCKEKLKIETLVWKFASMEDKNLHIVWMCHCSKKKQSYRCKQLQSNLLHQIKNCYRWCVEATIVNVEDQLQLALAFSILDERPLENDGSCNWN